MSKAPLTAEVHFTREKLAGGSRRWFAEKAAGGQRAPTTRELNALATLMANTFTLSDTAEATEARLTSIGGEVLPHSLEHPALVFESGRRVWFCHGRCHRDGDLPAIESADGSQTWYKMGELHRDGDLPAVVRADGTQRWYSNGEKHRATGPADIAGTEVSWWLRDQEHSLKRLLGDLRAGGVVIERLAGRPGKPFEGRYRLVRLSGEVVGKQRTIASAGWLDWIEANAHRYAPELAAAMRAKAMRAAMTGAPAPAGVRAPTPRRAPAPMV